MNRRRGNRTKQKGYNTKPKMMNIHFRYSDVVTDYAQALSAVDGHLSLLMDDCSQAELHNLDKIEFDAVLARLDTKGRESILTTMPTVGITCVTSMTSLQENATDDRPASAVLKPSLLSLRPETNSAVGSSQSMASNGNMKNSGGFGTIREEDEARPENATCGIPSEDSFKMASLGDPPTSKSFKSATGKLAASGSLLMASQKKNLRPNDLLSELQ